MKKLLLMGALSFFAFAPSQTAILTKTKQHLTVAPVTNFEIWNKSKTHTLFFALAPFLNEKQDVYELKPDQRITGYYDTSIGEHYLLYFATTPQDIAKSKGKGEIDGDVRIYKIGPTTKETTMYVRLGEEGMRFGPQTGPLLGKLRVTESGLGLKNNISAKQFDRFNIPAQPEWFIDEVTKMAKRYYR